MCKIGSMCASWIPTLFGPLSMMKLFLPFLTSFTTYWTTVGTFVEEQKNPSESLADGESIDRVIKNQLVWTPLSLLFYQFLFYGFFLFNPSPFHVGHVVWQIPACYVLHDLAFYLLHRIFHSLRLRHLHQQHHEWVDVKPVCAFDAHPVEHVIANVLPMFLASHLTGCCFIVYLLWIALWTHQSVYSHSGYDVRHALHHKFRVCNFGTWPYLSDMLGRTGRTR